MSQGFCCPTAELDEHLVIDALVDRVVSIKNGIDLDQIGIDSFAYIGAECVAIRGVNIAAGTITIDRGILDTVPVEHADSSRIWFADGWQGLDRTERVDAEFATLKIAAYYHIGYAGYRQRYGTVPHARQSLSATLSAGQHQTQCHTIPCKHHRRYSGHLEPPGPNPTNRVSG